MPGFNGALGAIGLVAFFASAAIVQLYDKRRSPFDPLVPTLICWLLLAVSYALVMIDWRIYQQGGLFGMSFFGAAWLFFAIFVRVALYRLSRRAGGR